jgi:hypothetical protein
LPVAGRATADSFSQSSLLKNNTVKTSRFVISMVHSYCAKNGAYGRWSKDEASYNVSNEKKCLDFDLQSNAEVKFRNRHNRKCHRIGRSRVRLPLVRGFRDFIHCDKFVCDFLGEKWFFFCFLRKYFVAGLGSLLFR